MKPRYRAKPHWPAWILAVGLFCLGAWQLWRVYPHSVAELAPGERPDPAAEAVEFGDVELRLAKLYQPGAAQLALAPKHRGLLEKTAELLPSQLSPAQWQRLRWLTQQAFPGAQGQELSRLLWGFYQWRDYQAQTPTFDAGALVAKRDYLKKTAAQLQQWLGPATAKTLFGRDLDVQYYLLRRRQVMADDTLSPAQKQTRLQQLSEQHKAGQLTLMSPGPDKPSHE